MSAASPSPTRAETTAATLLDAALEEFASFGFRRSSMESVARRAGVSRATLYAHWGAKSELFRGLVERLHEQHLAAMAAAAADLERPFEERLVAVLEARFLRFVELTSASPHAAELYDRHDRLCGDIARASQERSERLLARMLREAAGRGEVDLGRAALSAPRIATVLFDSAHGAKGEDPSSATPEQFRRRLADAVRVLVTGLGAQR